MVEMIGNILKIKENTTNKVDETVQLKDFLLSINNKVLALPLNIRFSILRMFHGVARSLSPLNAFSDVKILEFFAEYRNNLLEYLKNKNEEMLIIAMWLLTAIDLKPEDKVKILEFMESLRKDEEFESFLPETKYALLNLEMECVYFEIVKKEELRFNKLSSTLEQLFKSLESLLEAKNYELVSSIKKQELYINNQNFNRLLFSPRR